MIDDLIRLIKLRIIIVASIKDTDLRAEVQARLVAG